MSDWILAALRWPHLWVVFVVVIVVTWGSVLYWTSGWIVELYDHWRRMRLIKAQRREWAKDRADQHRREVDAAFRLHQDYERRLSEAKVGRYRRNDDGGQAA